MVINIDFKLVAHLRLHANRLRSEEFWIFGYSEPETTFIVSGWFESEPFLPPVGDTIVRLGSIQHTDFRRSGTGLLGVTDSVQIFSDENPIRFDDLKTQFIDAASLIRREFFFVYIKRSESTESTYFCFDDDIEHFLDLPIADGVQVPDDREVFLSEVVDTSRLETLKLSSTQIQAVGIFKNAYARSEALTQVWMYTNSRGSVSSTRNFEYLTHPVNISRPIRCPQVFRVQENNLLHDAHSRVTSLSSSIVGQGGYDYYHYGMDGVNDEGWGCAYRSLQTIMSWFSNNYGIGMKILSIHGIQATLKRVDYALADLAIGSRQWIGCVEGAAVLNDISGGLIVCRILHASNIQELSDIFHNTVRDHLTDFGCPVMIGAGKFAYTVIGVDVKTNSVLIVDPHFSNCSGRSENALINNKYIGWKVVTTFLDFKRIQGSFINVCIPSLGIYICIG